MFCPYYEAEPVNCIKCDISSAPIFKDSNGRGERLERCGWRYKSHYGWVCPKCVKKMKRKHMPKLQYWSGQ